MAREAFVMNNRTAARVRQLAQSQPGPNVDGHDTSSGRQVVWVTVTGTAVSGEGAGLDGWYPCRVEIGADGEAFTEFGYSLCKPHKGASLEVGQRYVAIRQKAKGGESRYRVVGGANWTHKTSGVEDVWHAGLIDTGAQSFKGPKTFRDVAAVRARIPAANGGMVFTWSGPIASSVVCSASGSPGGVDETNPDQLSAGEVDTSFTDTGFATARMYARHYRYGSGPAIKESTLALVADDSDPDVSSHIWMSTNGFASGIYSGAQGISFFGGGVVDFVTTSPMVMPNICIGSNAYIWHDGNLFASGPCYQILNENPPYDSYPEVGHHIGKYEDVDIPLAGGTTMTLHFRGGIYVDKSSRTTGDPSVPYSPRTPPDDPPEVPPIVPPPPAPLPVPSLPVPVPSPSTSPSAFGVPEGGSGAWKVMT